METYQWGAQNVKAPGSAGAGSGASGRTVSRVLFETSGFPRRSRWSSVWDDCRQPPRAAYPRLPLACARGCRCGPHLAAYLALLRLGVAVPPRLRSGRWALTPPFHPYPEGASAHEGPPPTTRRFLFCGPVRRLSAPRRYLAVCPLELGLSSRRLPGARPSRPACPRKITDEAGVGAAGAGRGRLGGPYPAPAPAAAWSASASSATIRRSSTCRRCSRWSRSLRFSPGT